MQVAEELQMQFLRLRGAKARRSAQDDGSQKKNLK